MALPGRRRTTWIVALSLVLALILGAGGYVWWSRWRLDQGLAAIKRVEAFPGREAGPVASTGPLTFLLAGSDARANTTGTKATSDPGLGHQRADAIMLIRVDASRTRAVAVSIPRDTLVNIPPHTDPQTGIEQPAQTRKINASYSLGGAALLVRTVEDLTGLTVDHYAEIDFEGVIQMVDDLGGVCVDNPHTTETNEPNNTYVDPSTGRPWRFEQGRLCLNGEQARVWVGQKPSAHGYDSYRVLLQQELLQELLAKRGGASLANPVALNDTLTVVSRVASVDNTLTDGALKTLAYSMRDLDVASLTTTTMPVTGRQTVRTDSGRPETVVRPVPAADACVWQAFLAVDERNMARCAAV